MKHPPLPPPEALAHQQKLLAYLKECCKVQGGLLPFADFMQAALYAPGLGYYSAGMHKLGAAGDFVTAPEISPLFAQCLATQCLQIFEHLPSNACILECGAGTGKMAGNIVRFLASHHVSLDCYYILEVSADLKQRQQAYLKAHYPDLFHIFTWLDQLPEHPFNGVILGNEVIDAMPVHLFKIGETGEILEGYVGCEKEQWYTQFNPAEKSITDAVHALQQHLPYPMSAGYTSEINLLLPQWLKSLTTSLAQGVMLWVDYGFPRHEYYHPSRHMGTLMCHYRHHAHVDFLKWIGLQDITAHVDFTAVATAAHASGLDVLGFTHQAAFLLGNHLLALAQAQDLDPKKQWQNAQQIQRLIQPHEMGELFKVIALGKNFSGQLQGFEISNQLHRL